VFFISFLVSRNDEFSLIKVLALCLVAEKSEGKWI